MPIMPRMSNKAKKIAYEVLGKPVNMTNDKRKRGRMEERLDYEETVRMR